MILCRSCGRISTGEPKFCEHCGKSFNATICPEKHESSITASHCSTCGSIELSTPARGIQLRVPNRLLAIVIGLVLLRVLTPLLPTLIGLMLNVIGWVFTTVFTPILCLLVHLILPFFIVWGIVGIFLQILSGERISLYRIYMGLSKRLFEALLVVARLIGELLLHLVFSRSTRPKKGDK